MVTHKHLILKELGSSALRQPACATSSLSLCCWESNLKPRSCHTDALSYNHSQAASDLALLGPQVLGSEKDEFVMILLQLYDYLYSPTIDRKMIDEKTLNIAKAK